MVAYNFQLRFVSKIEDGTKRNTIRQNANRRHVRAGENLQLYYAQRTKQCRKILKIDPVCKDTKPIAITVGKSKLTSIRIDGKPVSDLDAFALSDGFNDAKDMHAFWLESYGTGKFTGTIIYW